MSDTPRPEGSVMHQVWEHLPVNLNNSGAEAVYVELKS